MKKRIMFGIILAFLATIIACKDEKVAKPKLLIGIVVDQMRYDYLENYWETFGEDGFKRLVNNGFEVKNANFSYKPTYTGPGHASIFTGSLPKDHGIVGNSWFQKDLGESVYCVLEGNEDHSNSWDWLMRKTIADYIKKENDSAKTFAISLKDRGAVLPIGSTCDGAFWLDSESESWIGYSSSSSIANWLKEQGNINWKSKYFIKNWDLSLDRTSYFSSLPDSNSFEGKLSPKGKNFFPHQLSEAYDEIGLELLKRTPKGNTAIIDLAKVLILDQALGQDGIMDFLSLSFSATDYVGHRFGVDALEVQDTYIKLDKDLGNFLKWLDENVGSGEYSLFLTADHGASKNTGMLKSSGIDAGNINGQEIKESLKNGLDSIFGKQEWIAKFKNLNVYFDENAITASGYSRDTVFITSESILMKNASVSDVVIVKHFEEDSIANMVLAGCYKGRSGEIVIIEKENYVSYGATGSTHGSLYAYDQHVPLLFFGTGIIKGKTEDYYKIIDIVPTLSKLFAIPIEEKLEGESIW